MSGCAFRFVSAVELAAPEKYRVREEVLLVVSDYNDILKQLDAKERRLFRDRIQALDRRIAPGLQKVNWTSSKAILEFFLEATKHCHEAHKMVTSYKEAMAHVRDNCATIASTSPCPFSRRRCTSRVNS